MLDFIKLCRDKNISYLESGHHHCHDGWVQVHCPFCTEGIHGWHLGFSLEKGNLNCWRCGSHSAWEWLNVVFKNREESAKQIYKLYSINSASSVSATPIKVRGKKAKQPEGMEPLSKVHKQYLADRKFDYKKLVDEWNIQGTKNLSNEGWWWRIIAPVNNVSGSTVAYTGRALRPSVLPRWKFSREEEMSEDPKKLIYGIDKVQDRVLIVEGVSDVWRLGPGSAALLGIDWKVEQVFILKNYKHRFIMFDPEPEAQKRAVGLANWLAPFPGNTEIITGIGSDPGDLKQKEADNIMKELEFLND